MKNLQTIWIMAIMLALMPFAPEPHLWQKVKLLSNGYLKDAGDWFDLLWHSSGLIVAMVLTVLKFVKKRKETK